LYKLKNKSIQTGSKHFENNINKRKYIFHLADESFLKLQHPQIKRAWNIDINLISFSSKSINRIKPN